MISGRFTPDKLIEAVCKLQNFRYAPSKTIYWQHGRSNERDFIYVIPETLSVDRLAEISKDVGSKRSLLIMCRAFQGKARAFPNLTIKKIPDSFLKQYAWGEDDYRLNVAEEAASKAGKSARKASTRLER